MEVMDAARIEALCQPGPVGAVEVLGGELVQGDLAELGGDPLDLEPVAPESRTHVRGGTFWSQKGWSEPVPAELDGCSTAQPGAVQLQD